MAHDPSPSAPRISLLITVGVLVLAVAHAVVPALQIDSATLGLLAIAAIPWLAPILLQTCRVRTLAPAAHRAEVAEAFTRRKLVTT